MRKKKGQATIFMVIAVIILISGALLFFSSETSENAGVEESTELSSLAQPISAYVDSCLKDSLETGILFNSLQGGYAFAPENSFEFGGLKVPYYFSDGIPYLPGKDVLENELSSFIEIFLPTCIKNFTPFLELGYLVEEGQSRASAILTEQGTSATIEFPLEISKGSQTSRLDSFIARSDFSLLSKYFIAEETIREQEEDTDYIPIGHITNSAYKNNFTFELIRYPDLSFIYAYFFNSTELVNQQYLFVFAIKYGSSDEVEKLVSIKTIENQEAYAGYEFVYQVEASGSNLRYSDTSPLFDIDESGIISFTPTNTDGGLHTALITVQDDQGNKDSQIIAIEVKESNRQPILEEIPDLIARVNEPFAYRVQASDSDGDAVFYLDNTDLFDIFTSTGLIGFTPTSDMVGDHTIIITAVDEKGLIDVEEFTLVIG